MGAVLGDHARDNVGGQSYLQILAHGGSKAPAEILEEDGIDVASPAFWQGGFDVIRDLIRQLEEVSA